MEDRKLKELIPKLYPIGAIGMMDERSKLVYSEDEVKQQTENLRKAVNQLVNLHSIHPSDLGNMLQWWAETMGLIEQITGKKYNEL